MGIIQKLKLAWKLRREVKKIKEAYMEDSSFVSRKFLLTLVTAIASFWGAAQGFLPQELAIKIGAGIVAVFVVMNTLLRVAAMLATFTKTTKDDEAIANITEAIAELQKKLSPAVNVNVDAKPAVTVVPAAPGK